MTRTPSFSSVMKTCSPVTRSRSMRSPAFPGRSTLVFSAGMTSGAPKGASFSSSARGARTGRASRLPPVKRVTVAVSGEGQAMGQ